MEKTIYDLDLHEILFIKNKGLVVERVPSGWNYIYTKQVFIEEEDCYEKVVIQIVFVPYDEYFINNNTNK